MRDSKIFQKVFCSIELDGDEDGYISAKEIFDFMTEHGENITMEDAHSMVELAGTSKLNKTLCHSLFVVETEITLEDLKRMNL